MFERQNGRRAHLFRKGYYELTASFYMIGRPAGNKGNKGAHGWTGVRFPGGGSSALPAQSRRTLVRELQALVCTEGKTEGKAPAFADAFAGDGASQSYPDVRSATLRLRLRGHAPHFHQLVHQASLATSSLPRRATSSLPRHDTSLTPPARAPAHAAAADTAALAAALFAARAAPGSPARRQRWRRPARRRLEPQAAPPAHDRGAPALRPLRGVAPVGSLAGGRGGRGARRRRRGRL